MHNIGGLSATVCAEYGCGRNGLRDIVRRLSRLSYYGLRRISRCRVAEDRLSIGVRVIRRIGVRVIRWLIG